MSRRVWQVSELIRELNALLEQGFANIAVEGEVSNLSTSGRGHLYFSLKDGEAALDCVMWSSRARRLKFETEDGLAVLAVGSMTVYPQRGRLQLVVEELEPQGIGALQLAFEQLKRRLDAEGLFAPERKRALPALPQRVGIVTSPTGAALRDMVQVLRRMPHLEVIVAPARVQGEGAGAEVADALTRLGNSGLVDVVIVGRGGGSLEDLWAFNEEVVARAIAACPVAVISGVGHEVDFTIADFVADLRATTPTQAAEIVVARLEQQQRRLAEAEAGLARDLRRHLQLARTRLTGLEGSSGLARVPERVRLLTARLQRVDRLPLLLRGLVQRVRGRLAAAEGSLRRVPARMAAGSQRRLLVSRREQMSQLMGARLRRLRATVATAERGLVHLSPRKVLQRGYSITRLEDSPQPLKDAGSARSGQVLLTTLARGELRSVVAAPARTRSRGKDSGASQVSLFDDDQEA
jgi:exodeoxyribonuclease VII large subunit